MGGPFAQRRTVRPPGGIIAELRPAVNRSVALARRKRRSGLSSADGTEPEWLYTRVVGGDLFIVWRRRTTG
jgi:hypothetical protein